MARKIVVENPVLDRATVFMIAYVAVTVDRSAIDEFKNANRREPTDADLVKMAGACVATSDGLYHSYPAIGDDGKPVVQREMTPGSRFVMVG